MKIFNSCTKEDFPLTYNINYGTVGHINNLLPLKNVHLSFFSFRQYRGS